MFGMIIRGILFFGFLFLTALISGKIERNFIQKFPKIMRPRVELMIEEGYSFKEIERAVLGE